MTVRVLRIFNVIDHEDWGRHRSFVELHYHVPISLTGDRGVLHSAADRVALAVGNRITCDKGHVSRTSTPSARLIRHIPVRSIATFAARRSGDGFASTMIRFPGPILPTSMNGRCR